MPLRQWLYSFRKNNSNSFSSTKLVVCPLTKFPPFGLNIMSTSLKENEPFVILKCGHGQTTTDNRYMSETYSAVLRICLWGVVLFQWGVHSTNTAIFVPSKRQNAFAVAKTSKPPYCQQKKEQFYLHSVTSEQNVLRCNGLLTNTKIARDVYNKTNQKPKTES